MPQKLTKSHHKSAYLYWLQNDKPDKKLPIDTLLTEIHQEEISYNFFVIR